MSKPEAVLIPDLEPYFSYLSGQIDALMLKADLSERERQVITLRFGFDRGQGRRLEEVADVFKVTRERIRQIEAKAMHKMRAVDEANWEPFARYAKYAGLLRFAQWMEETKQ